MAEIDLGLARIPKIAMSFAILIFMLIIDYYWGAFIFTFAEGLAGDAGLLIKLMIMFTLLFGTFIIPILVYLEQLNPNPFNLIYGIMTMILGITIVMTILWVIEPIATLLLTGLGQGSYLIIINAVMLLTIIFFGFINPIFAMLQDDRMDKVIIQKVTGETQ